MMHFSILLNFHNAWSKTPHILYSNRSTAWTFLLKWKWQSRGSETYSVYWGTNYSLGFSERHFYLMFLCKAKVQIRLSLLLSCVSSCFSFFIMSHLQCMIWTGLDVGEAVQWRKIHPSIFHNIINRRHTSRTNHTQWYFMASFTVIYTVKSKDSLESGSQKYWITVSP